MIYARLVHDNTNIVEMRLPTDKPHYVYFNGRHFKFQTWEEGKAILVEYEGPKEPRPSRKVLGRKAKDRLDAAIVGEGKRDMGKEEYRRKLALVMAALRDDLVIPNVESMTEREK